jgi:hypothetical protein
VSFYYFYNPKAFDPSTTALGVIAGEELRRRKYKIIDNNEIIAALPPISPNLQSTLINLPQLMPDLDFYELSEDEQIAIILLLN